MSTSAKFVFVPNRLGQLLKAPGGITREEAVEEARQALETLRDTSGDVVWGLIADIEGVVATGTARKERVFQGDELLLLLNQAESIINYADLFGYSDLDSVTRSLCHLIVIMLEREIRTVEPVAVHARAMRLVGPGLNARAPEELQLLHAQFRRIIEHVQRQAPAHEA